MRIAVFIKSTTFHAGYGGLETQNKVLCEGLRSLGHEVTVFSQKKELAEDSQDLNGVKYIFIPSVYRYLFSSMNANSWERKSVEVFKSLHDKKSFDLAISQSSAGIGIIKNKQELGIKVISIAHGTTIGELKTYFQNIRNLKDFYWAMRNVQYVLRQFFGRQREYILGADKVVAVSNAVKSQLIEETYVDENKVVVIHNGVNASLFNFDRHSYQEGSGMPVWVIYTGRVVRSKGLFDFVKILSEIPAQEGVNYKFEVVGEGEDMEELKSYVRTLKLEDKVVFSGKVSHEEVIAKLFNADIFVLPSKRIEGFPMTLPEAMLAYLPVLATEIGGIPDAVEDGVTGYLVKPEDCGNMRNKITGLLRDLKLREYMGENGRIKAEKEFTLEVMLDAYQNTIKELVG